MYFFFNYIFVTRPLGNVHVSRRRRLTKAYVSESREHNKRRRFEMWNVRHSVRVQNALNITFVLL